MSNNIVQNLIRWFVLVLVQVLILSQVNFGGYIHPYLYILFILLLPFETPGWLVLILGFITGITVDAFQDTLGMHASATTFLGFFRGHLLEWIAPRDGYETGMNPHLQDMGFGWHFRYAAILTIVHHFWLFLVEVFRFEDLHHTLLRALLSSIFTLILIIFSQLLFFKQGKRRA